MIFLKSESDIANMRVAGKVVSNALQSIKQYIAVGVTTLEIDKILEDFVLSAGVVPSFKGYNGYKFASCVSVNSTVVHGLPNSYKLQVGDIVGVDIAVHFKGWHADAARTFGVQKISGQNQRLIQTAQDCFFEGIKFATPNFKIGDIGFAIEKLATSRGYGVVKDLTGHGIGKSLHEDPSVPNYGVAGRGAKIKTGMALAIEPMINIGTEKVEVDPID